MHRSGDRTRLKWQAVCFQSESIAGHTPLTHSGSHATVTIVEIVLVETLQAHQAGVSAVGGRHTWSRRNAGHVLLHVNRVDGTDGICPRSH